MFGQKKVGKYLDYARSGLLVEHQRNEILGEDHIVGYGRSGLSLINGFLLSQ